MSWYGYVFTLLSVVLWADTFRRLRAARRLRRAAAAQAIQAGLDGATAPRYTIPEPTGQRTAPAPMPVWCMDCRAPHAADQCPLVGTPRGSRWCDRCEAVHGPVERCPLWGEHIQLCRGCASVFTADSRGCGDCMAKERAHG